MRIVVTGHLGTIGGPLLRRLRDKHEVVGVDLLHSPDGIRADAAEHRQIAEMPECDMVYHLAAEFGRHNGEDYTEQLWRSNVIGTKNILRLQKDRGFRLVFASSSEVYGEQRVSILDESMIAPHPSMLTNDYAISKWVNESQIAQAERSHDAQIMTLRFFNAYGPGERYHKYRSVVCLFAYRALMGLPYTVYDGYHRVFQYIDDLVDTLVGCADRFSPGEVINVGGDDYRSVNEMHEIVSRCVGISPERSEVAHSENDAHNIVNKRPDISKARNLLGHDPRVRLEEGIAKTVAWMREQYA